METITEQYVTLFDLQGCTIYVGNYGLYNLIYICSLYLSYHNVYINL